MKEKLKAGDKEGAKKSLEKRKLLIEQIKQYKSDLYALEIQKLEFDDIQDLDYNSLYDRVNDLQEEAKEKLKNGDKKGAKKILIRKNFSLRK